MALIKSSNTRLKEPVREADEKRMLTRQVKERERERERERESLQQGIDLHRFVRCKSLYTQV